MKICEFASLLDCGLRSIIGISSDLSSFRGLQCCWHCTDNTEKSCCYLNTNVDHGIRKI